MIALLALDVIHHLDMVCGVDDKGGLFLERDSLFFCLWSA